MLTSVRLVDFKNFADATLRLGPLTVIIGTNASGKSNIRDAFRFLHGIGRGYSLNEILQGKYGPGGQSEWERLRGAIYEITRLGRSESHIETTFMFDLIKMEYGLMFKILGGNHFNVVSPYEFATLNGELLYSTTLQSIYLFPEIGFEIDSPKLERVEDVSAAGIRNQAVRLRSFAWQVYSSPLLRHIQDISEIKTSRLYNLKYISGVLASLRFLDPFPAAIRRPSFPGQTVLGDQGENLSSVLMDIFAEPERKAALLSWLRELTPTDVEDLDFVPFPNGAVQLALVEPGGRKVSAESASDGTLRFLAILGALLSPNPPKLIFFEEVELGIHPSRQWVLVDMLQRLTRERGIQVVTTTHSPDFLTMIDDETMKTTSVVFRPPGKDYAVIKPITELPNIDHLRKTQGLGRLISSRWFEDALTLMQEEEAEVPPLPDSDGVSRDDEDGSTGRGGSSEAEE
ncbi:MAG: hypothetical protein RLY86_1165 [Pseudomonadota bacterium]|jgi:predicted ATPase